MTKTEKRIRFIQKFSRLTRFAIRQGIQFIITAAFRTAEEQRALYNAGLSKCDGYNKISNHQEWLAYDIAIIKDGKAVWKRTDGYDSLGNFWLAIGGGWDASSEGNLDDPYHFEYNPTE